MRYPNGPMGWYRHGIRGGGYHPNFKGMVWESQGYTVPWDIPMESHTILAMVWESEEGLDLISCHIFLVSTLAAT